MTQIWGRGDREHWKPDAGFKIIAKGPILGPKPTRQSSAETNAKFCRYEKRTKGPSTGWDGRNLACQQPALKISDTLGDHEQDMNQSCDAAVNAMLGCIDRDIQISNLDHKKQEFSSVLH